MNLDGDTLDELGFARASWDALSSLFWLMDDRRREVVRERSRERRVHAALRRGPRRKAGPKLGSVAGERNPAARLTAEQVDQIRRALDDAKTHGARGSLVRALAEQAQRFRVSEATVKKIRAGKLWRNAS